MTKSNERHVYFNKPARVLALARQPGRWIDKSHAGFGMRVSPKGKAVWFVRFRDAEGKEVSETLGSVDATGDGLSGISYEVALEKSRRVRSEAMKTEQERELQRGLAEYSTLAGVFEKYLADRRKKDGEPLAPTTKADYRKLFKQYLQPVKNWNLPEIRAFQWKDFLIDIQKRSPAKAVYCKNVISGIYTYLMANDLVDSNPMAKVTQQRIIARPVPRKGRVDTVDLPAYFKAIGSKLSRQDSKDALLILTLTGTRLRAGLGMRWDQLHLDDGYYEVLPQQEGWKGFVGVLPLSDAVCELLCARRKRRAAGDTGYIFPKRHGSGNPPHQTKVSDALLAIASELPYRPRPHDLRRTFASVSAMALRNDFQKVGALLTHKWAANREGTVVTQTAITRQYIQTDLNSLRAAANLAANFMLELAEQRAMSAESREILGREGLDPMKFALIELPEEGEERALAEMAV
ncbi:tyrosine-type recombinase/integrase [Achromobacter mucicolens]|uniref:tyrosine-type recombinase/integrase n=1 Tax=Achromobacter mucicolens TaxID=1389922 RepID=UPI003B9D84DC